MKGRQQPARAAQVLPLNTRTHAPTHAPTSATRQVLDLKQGLAVKQALLLQLRLTPALPPV